MELSNPTCVIAPTLNRQLFMTAKQYDDMVVFTLGDPDIPTPLPICEAAINTAKAGHTRYASNGGLPALREAIAKQVSKESEIAYEANNVEVTVGATEAVYLSFMACFNSDDEVFWHLTGYSTRIS